MRERHPDFRARGSEVIALGTGDASYARAFVDEEQIPYPVLVDEDGAAAKAAAVTVSSFLGLFHPRSWAGTWQTYQRGYRVHAAGPRVTQLGATFVIGPGPELLYSHLDGDATDHAPIDDVLAAIPTA